MNILKKMLSIMCIANKDLVKFDSLCDSKYYINKAKREGK